MARIVSVGAALQDVYLIDHDDFGTNKRGYFNQIELGTKIDIDKIKFSTGGGASNAATTFARFGHESIFMGCIADDPAGAAIVSSFDDEGIDNSYTVYIPDSHTGYSLVLLTPGGERTILTCRGASAKFDAIDPNDLENIHPDWIYVTTFRGNMDALDRLFTKARSLGAKIMFNPGNLELKNTRKMLGLLSDVEVLLLNKDEAKKLVDGSIFSEIFSRVKNYVPVAIVTDGSQGAFASDGNETYRLGLYEDVPVKDSTGAGDAFGSGFLAAYADGRSFKDSLVFASANSTSVIQKVGSKAGIITKHKHLHDMPIQEVR
ncbi:carbohydrate kinase family protein [Candidatus Saccharibacteria bacterium]|nr:carbohydrate kinase family protein [Candidatus Saccharibacteria bacterium]MBP5656209.1 carbohydrate kinase family protein [Candidatus Saccharibacteria bacterium]